MALNTRPARQRSSCADASGRQHPACFALFRQKKSPNLRLLQVSFSSPTLDLLVLLLLCKISSEHWQRRVLRTGLRLLFFVWWLPLLLLLLLLNLELGEMLQLVFDPAGVLQLIWRFLHSFHVVVLLLCSIELVVVVL
jgi:hypothetical protein